MATVADQVRSALLAKADALVRRAHDDLAALIHADFVYVNAGGRAFGKAGYIETYCTSGTILFLSQQVSDLRITPFDGFAVATLALAPALAVSGPACCRQGGRDYEVTFVHRC